MNDPANPVRDSQPLLDSHRHENPLGAIGGLSGDCGAMLAGLYHYLDGELTEERRHHIQSHLDDCQTCFGAFDFEAELRIVVRSRIQLRVPEALIQRIRIAIRDEPLG